MARVLRLWHPYENLTRLVCLWLNLGQNVGLRAPSRCYFLGESSRIWMSLNQIFILGP